jgi:hypothetical protein
VVPSDVTCEGIDGAWIFENVSRTADTISHDGDLALSAGGAMRVAFAEPLADPIFDQDILIADRAECDWRASTPMTSDTEVQNAYPSLAVEGDTFHLVWSGYPEGRAPSDFAPSLAVADDGAVYIAFWRDNAEGKSDVLLTSSADGATFTPPCNLTRTAADNEWMPSALQLDPAGKLHLLYEQFVPDSDPLDTEIIHGRIL